METTEAHQQVEIERTAEFGIYSGSAVIWFERLRLAEARRSILSETKKRYLDKCLGHTVESY